MGRDQRWLIKQTNRTKHLRSPVQFARVRRCIEQNGTVPLFSSVQINPESNSTLVRFGFGKFELLQQSLSNSHIFAMNQNLNEWKEMKGIDVNLKWDDTSRRFHITCLPGTYLMFKSTFLLTSNFVMWWVEYFPRVEFHPLYLRCSYIHTRQLPFFCFMGTQKIPPRFNLSDRLKHTHESWDQSIPIEVLRSSTESSLLGSVYRCDRVPSAHRRDHLAIDAGDLRSNRLTWADIRMFHNNGERYKFNSKKNLIRHPHPVYTMFV